MSIWCRVWGKGKGEGGEGKGQQLGRALVQPGLVGYNMAILYGGLIAFLISQTAKEP